MIADDFMFGFLLVDTGLVVFLLIYYVSRWFSLKFSPQHSDIFFPSRTFLQVLILSDLECDYLNAQQCCSKLNFWTIPKVTAHVITAALLLFSGHWILFLVNMPFLGYLLYEWWTVPKGNMGIYDPCEIHVSWYIVVCTDVCSVFSIYAFYSIAYLQNRGQIKTHMTLCIVFIGFYLLIFFVYLYKWVVKHSCEQP